MRNLLIAILAIGISTTASAQSILSLQCLNPERTLAFAHRNADARGGKAFVISASDTSKIIVWMNSSVAGAPVQAEKIIVSEYPSIDRAIIAIVNGNCAAPVVMIPLQVWRGIVIKAVGADS